MVCYFHLFVIWYASFIEFLLDDISISPLVDYIMLPIVDVAQLLNEFS